MFIETLEIILKYSNLFDFDQLLISTQIGSIEEMRVSEVLKTGIKLLEDSIQHTTSSYVLVKVSLAQFIDDIDFRILTYLEQQLKQQYPDIRVRQVTASTFANDFQAAVLDLLVQLLLIRHFIYCIAEFLVMLSHDTLHSKQVIKVQDLIKHYDLLLASGHEPETHALAALKAVLYDFFLALRLFTVIVNKVQIEDDKWKRLSRQIVYVLLVHLQSHVTIGLSQIYDFILAKQFRTIINDFR
ncbi:unnamed protein product [Rotaria sp. Silwood1]|nr:unnamed protein product [Rotaria sp. Silwood1]CAF1648774.1 unnamed protein product [Rotaria sp. Silwood1]